MVSDKQIQKAGDGSNQFQAENVNLTIINGIDEKRAREVYSEMSARAIQDCTEEATAKAMDRIERFERIVIPRIEQIENDFKSFSEPSFQFLLKSAQKTAACTEREADYQMLSELLVRRIERGEDRKSKTSISKAVEIVDQIDDDALCGLTVVQAINQWLPVAGDISTGLGVLNELFLSLAYRALPQGFEWVYHLDLLNAVRVSSIGTFKKMKDFYPDTLSGYTCIGIEKNSDLYNKAVEELEKANLSREILVDHELMENYVRIPVINREAIANLSMNTRIPNSNVIVRRALTDNEVKAIQCVWDMYEHDESKRTRIRNEFMKKWDSYETLKMVRIWWEAMPHSFDITSVGKVLAHANAKRYNDKVPDLD